MWGRWWERSEELVVLWCGCSSREMRNWTSVKHTACCIYGYGSIEYHGNPISTKGCKCLKYGSCLWRALSLVGGGASRICTASASSQRSRGYNFDLHLSFRDCLKSPPSTYSTTIWVSAKNFLGRSLCLTKYRINDCTSTAGGSLTYSLRGIMADPVLDHGHSSPQLHDST